MGIRSALNKGRDAAIAAAGRAKKASEEIVERVTPAAQKAAELAAEQGARGAEYAVARAREFASTPRGRKIVKGGAIGGLAGLPIPLVGPVTGALLGAAAGWWAGRGPEQASEELERRCRALSPSECLRELDALEDLYEGGHISEERYLEVRKALTGK